MRDESYFKKNILEFLLREYESNISGNSTIENTTGFQDNIVTSFFKKSSEDGIINYKAFIPIIKEEISDINFEAYRTISSIDPLLTRKFLSIIDDDIFEFGYISKSEIFIKNLIKNNPSEIKLWLNEIFLKYFNDVNTTTAILHVISHLEYEIIKPTGPTIAIAATRHKDVTVRDCAIRAFENWGPCSLIYLKSLHFEEKWLMDYMNQVITDLECDFAGNGTSCKKD